MLQRGQQPGGPLGRRREILDQPSLPPAEARRALADLSRVNRWSFSSLTPLRCLLRRLGNSPATLLDVGSGTGELLPPLVSAAARQGSELRTVALDRKLDHLAYGRGLGVDCPAVVADVEALPFRDGSFDWSLSSLLLHHFEADACRRVLAEMLRVAKRGTVVSDLRRGVWTRLAVRLLLILLRVGPIAAQDGRDSADRAWSLAEAKRIANGFDIREIRRRFPCRFSLVLGKES